MKKIGVGIIGSGGIAQSVPHPLATRSWRTLKFLPSADANPAVAEAATTKFGTSPPVHRLPPDARDA